MPFHRQLTLADLWLMLQRRKWLLILPCVGIFAGTVLFSLTLPNIYRASTVILVEAPKVPETYVQSTVATTTKERLRTIAEQIKSRTRLEKVILELRLVEDSTNRHALDRYIANMNGNIDVTVQANDAFTVSYASTDPNTTMLVTNKLASLFIEENVKVREQYAISTTEFLEGESLRIRDLLEKQEKIITTYKQRYMGELPEQQDANQRALDRLQLQLQSHRESLDNAQNRKSLLLQQLATQEPDAPVEAPQVDPEAVHPIEQQLVQQIAQRRQALAELQRLHTDRYPDIGHLQRSIAELENQLTAYRATQPPPKRRPAVAVGKATSNALRKRIQDEILQTELDIAKLQRNLSSVQEQITLYEKKVTNTAQREQELMVLTRDYESTRKNYESLLARQMQAKMAENLERRQKAEQFRVLDPARVPNKPWKPQRAMILLMGLGAGLAVGGTGVFLVEYLDQSFHDSEDLENFTALPVLATIPFLPTPMEQPHKHRKQKFLYAACMLLPVVTLTAVHMFGVKLDLLLVRTLQLLHP